MLNFEIELNKLLLRETEPPLYSIFAPAVEMASLGNDILKDLQKRQTDVSLQVEEIYDLLKDQDTHILAEAYQSEKKQADSLALASVAICDLLEDFCAYARQSGNEDLQHQADILWRKSEQLLASSNLVRFGTTDQLLNPQIHTVTKGVESSHPREMVLQVLQSGYLYKNDIIRKAAVVVSLGQAHKPEQNEEEQNIQIEQTDTGMDANGGQRE
ncbi:MAG: hypothetical protein Ta2B_09930 [Termitinemataceae bacterium]|nr:MAG: hypothetical protein Ta2B_09930 [Termitinemataceae bacterium]